MDRLLSDQLTVLNALIGIRGDWDKQARVAVVTDAGSGERFSLGAQGKFDYADPRVLKEDLGDNGEERMTLRFASERQVQVYLSKMRASGKTVRITSREEGKAYRPQPISLGWTLGGQEALREIGRVALNLLADQYPILARVPDLRPFKDWVQGKGGGDFVSNYFGLKESSGFEFGHLISLYLDPDSGRVAGIVSFFDSIDYLVTFGVLHPPVPEVCHIALNPEADRPPNDKVVRKQQGPVSLPTPGGLPDLNAFSERLDGLFGRIQERQWKLTSASMLPRLNELRALPEHRRFPQVMELLGPQMQRILNLLSHSVEHFVAQVKKPEFAPYVAILRQFISVDEHGELSEFGQMALHLVTNHVAAVLVSDLANGPIIDRRLRALLAGGEGAALAFKAVSDIVLDVIGDRENETRS